MITEDIKNLIQQACADLHFEVGEIELEHPENSAHGDYSTNVALVLAKQLGQNPREVAESIIGKLKIISLRDMSRRDRNSKFLDNVEVAGPGFINFFLAKGFFVQELSQILKQKEKYGAGKNKKKVIVEFTDPNPFKVFHIGHLYDNAIGESLSRLFAATGATVKRANYQGDVGMHVAKAIWGMQQLSHKMPKSSDSLSQKVKWLGMCYAAGTFTEDTEREELERINKAVYDRSDKKIVQLYNMGKKWSLDYFDTIYKRLGTKFDYSYFESKVGKIGLALVQKGLEKGIFEKSQGAVIFPGEKYGLRSRVFINSLGLPTYEAKELGLAPTKYKDFKYDLSVIVTGNEIIDYFKVILCALSKLYPELAEKTKHISHGMVQLPEGKMSSRTGNVITAEDLLNEVKSRVLEIMNVAGNEIPEKERDAVAEMITIGAIKYSFLRVSVGKDIAFDFKKSLSLEGESGPYLQYTYARCRSILRKAKLSSVKLKLNLVKFSPEEMALLRLLYRFPEVVKEAAEKFSPNLLCNFVFDVAQRYNLFYNTSPVLKAETKELKDFRLALTAAVAQVIKNSLSLLGIAVPERM